MTLTEPNNPTTSDRDKSAAAAAPDANAGLIPFTTEGSPESVAATLTPVVLTPPGGGLFGLVNGFREMPAAFWFIVRTPPAWPLALMPAAVALVLIVLLVYYGIPWERAVVAAQIGEVQSIWARAAVWVFGLFADLGTLVLCVILAIVMAQPLASPANEAMVRRRREALGLLPWPDGPVVAGVVSSIKTGLATVLFGLPPLAVLWTIGALLPFTLVVVVPLKIGWSALLAAWNLLDCPFSQAGLGVRARLAWARRNLAAMLGFGLACIVLAMIPLADVFLVPVGVAAAAGLLSRTLPDLERQ